MTNYSPLQEIFPPGASAIRVFMKRDDLLHPEIHGNKWRKLAPVIQAMGDSKKGLLSFGGAFSNHLHALAAAGKLFGFPSIGIIRGSSADMENPTLLHARQCGMQLFPAPKTTYEVLKRSELSEIFQFLGISPAFPFQVLREGGDTVEALVACAEIPAEVRTQLPQDIGGPLCFCVPAGTACTAAGVIAGAGPNARTLIFPAAPYGIERENILARLQAAGFTENYDFQIVENVLPKKFAQMTPELLDFVRIFRQNESILLDPVYTSKMMFKLYELSAQQFFPPGSCVVALHTGGLQGWQGYPPEITTQIDD